MDRYRKVVDKPKDDIPINDNEIRITSKGLIRYYIDYGCNLLQERHEKEIVFKAMGLAIGKTVAIAEILKRRIPQLHQDTAISSVSVTDVWEPIEEGLETVEQKRHVSMITITLSTKELNKNSPGYQAPSMEQGRAQSNYPPHSQRQPPRQHDIYNSESEDSYSRGRGGGRGRGRIWNRGGYENYQGNGGYTHSGRGGDYGYRDGGYSGRGGGYGYRDGGYSGSDRGEYTGSGRVGYSGSGRGGSYGYREDDGYSGSGRGGYSGSGRGRYSGSDRGGGYGYQDGGYSGSSRGGGNGYRENGGYSGSGRGGGNGYRENGGYSGSGRGGGNGYRENDGYSNGEQGDGYGYGGYSRGRGGGSGRGYARGAGRGRRDGGNQE